MALEDRLVSELLRSPGVEEAPSQFAVAAALWVEGREFLHFHGRQVEIRLTRKVISVHRARLKADARVGLRSTDWVEVRLTHQTDLPLALELAGLAAEANRRAGQRPRRLPDDREMARRRRSHGLPTNDLRP